MKRVLLVSPFFPPSAASGSFRLLGLARYLPREDWEVRVLTASSVPDEPEDPRLLDKLPENSNLVRVAYPSSRYVWIATNAAARSRFLDSHWLWVLRALKRARLEVKRWRPDMVLTSSPPHSVHWIGWFLKKHYSIPWTVDLRDPMTFGLRSHGSRTVERTYFEAADRIILNAPGAQRAFESAYPEFADKGRVIPNGFDPDDYQHTPKPRGAECLIVHAGETYADRDPKLLFDVLARCRQTGTLEPVRLEFLGRQNNDYDPVAYCNSLGIQDLVKFRGQVPHAEVAKSLERADVLLLLDNPGRVTGVPAKLYEYLAAKRQILALTEPAGDSAWLLGETGVSHQLAAPGDPRAIETALRRILGDDSPTIGDRLSDRVLAFSRQALTKRLSDAMCEVLER